MEKYVVRGSLIVALLFFTSCGGDSGDKLMKDQLDYMEEVAGVLDEVSDGGNASEAAEKIKELGKKGDEFMERKTALFGEAGDADLQQLTEKYSERARESARKMMEAIQRLEKSGRVTAELQEAIINMKSGS